MPDAIILERLRKAYGTFVAVDELSLRIGEGELVGLLGPNGAGKTTAMRMLMGLLKPSDGRAEILGRDCFAARAEVMRSVGYVPDEPAFHDYLTGRELLRFVGGMHGLDAAELRERATASFFFMPFE
jgi:ABC-2 type transport system ATP-binding protein